MVTLRERHKTLELRLSDMVHYGQENEAIAEKLHRWTRGLLLQRQARALPDHYSYDHSPFTDLDADSILITPKDAVKCRKFDDSRLYSVHPGPCFSDPTWLDLVHELLQAISVRKLTSARSEALHSEF